MLRYVLPLALLTAGCAMTPREAERAAADDARNQARIDAALAGYVAQAPVDCLDPRGAASEIYGDTLVYRTGRRLYVNKTSGGCFGLKRDDIIVSRTFTGRFCRGDILHTVDRTIGTPSGSCVYGSFIPYVRPPKR